MYLNVKSGAPQGSHLTSLLYIIYINDCKFIIKSSKILKCIDDMKIYKEIKDINDKKLLNEDLKMMCK